MAAELAADAASVIETRTGICNQHGLDALRIADGAVDVPFPDPARISNLVVGARRGVVFGTTTEPGPRHSPRRGDISAQQRVTVHYRSGD